MLLAQPNHGYTFYSVATDRIGNREVEVDPAVAEASTVFQRLAEDFDYDCDQDLADHAVFSTCVAGPGVKVAPSGCDQDTFNKADLDHDGDVDTRDFALFQVAFASGR